MMKYQPKTKKKPHSMLDLSYSVKGIGSASLLIFYMNIYVLSFVFTIACGVG
jgi:hypothetical protein